MSKKRIDERVVELGLAPDSTAAAKLIMAGKVFVDECLVDKPGTLITLKSSVRILKQKRYVSRGGEKLIAALRHFHFSQNNFVAIDIGSSTGGFTDCLLQEGARRVYCIDVGTNQLDWKLRNDDRTEVFEGVNARLLHEELDFPLAPSPSVAVVDVSFISATLVLEPLLKALTKPFEIYLLVKPQFELKKEEISEGGVVPQKELQRKACTKVSLFACNLGLNVQGPFASPVKGQKKGNQEHFLRITS